MELMNESRKQNENRCYTVEDLMEILGVGRKAVYSLLRSKQFFYIQLKGVGYRIPKDSFDNWLLNRTGTVPATD